MNIDTFSFGENRVSTFSLLLILLTSKKVDFQRSKITADFKNNFF